MFYNPQGSKHITSMRLSSAWQQITRRRSGEPGARSAPWGIALLYFPRLEDPRLRDKLAQSQRIAEKELGGLLYPCDPGVRRRFHDCGAGSCAICTSCRWVLRPFVDSVRNPGARPIRKDEPVKQWPVPCLGLNSCSLFESSKPLQQVA